MYRPPRTKAEAKSHPPGLYGYGRVYNPERCAWSVAHGRVPMREQCSRAPGHGPDELYCRQHAAKLRGKS